MPFFWASERSSSLTPNSESEQHIPLLSYPAIFVGFITKPLALRSAPGNATITFKSLRALGAPQTIL